MQFIPGEQSVNTGSEIKITLTFCTVLSFSVMQVALEKARSRVNNTRFNRDTDNGHYESFFIRANHPDKAEAFWVRYTIFSPKDEPGQTIGELWAVYFDADKGHTALKDEISFDDCEFARNYFHVRTGNAELNSEKATGSIKKGDISLSWDLTYKSEEEPLFLLPLSLYEAPFPKAKSLVSQPNALFNGSFTINGKTVSIKNWQGSQNHNWGEKHTDSYAWGQVAGFDNSASSFLEVATARIKLGFFQTPALTPLVLRHEGHEYLFNDLVQTYLNRAEFKFFEWNFRAENTEAIITGRIHAAPEAFTGLPYYNPPGGIKHCLNSKIAACSLEVEEKSKIGRKFSLKTRNRAAFEILTDDPEHGISMLSVK